MAPTGGVLAAANEIDDVRWVALARAGDWLTYERDRALLERFDPARASD
jgi:hypothetical protein